MSNYYREQVASALQAIILHSPTTYSWFGKLSPRLSPSVRRALTPQSAREYLLSTLQFQLYNDFYCLGLAVPARQESMGSPTTGMPLFVRKLSAANSGVGYWEQGWEVRELQDDKVVVSRRGLKLWVHPEDCLLPRGSTILSGMRLCIRIPREFLGISPGFYVALSNKEFTEDDNSKSLVRFYWNLTAEGAVHFMRSTTSMLNQANLPFKLKVLNDPTRFTRCDAALLYVRKNDYDTVSEVLGRVHLEIATNLKQGTPVFTKPITEGVGLSEDPGQGDSFGLHRCRLLADGVICAYEQGKKSMDQRLQIVAERFAENGISLEEPFLSPGSRDIYYFQPQYKQPSRLSADAITKPPPDPDPRTFLWMADEIGRRLSHEAVWHEDRCNWLGADPSVDRCINTQLGTIYRALGPELYSGTSGIALFLAELCAVTQDALVHRSALGAIRQALSCVDALQPPNRLGLYTGWVGIAFAAARVGAILGEEELLHLATQLLQRSARENQEKCEFDLLSGNAGAIAALVVLQDMLNDVSLLEFAVRLGEELVCIADRFDTDYSWKSPTFPTRRNLTGFSQGAAGVGYALVELFLATGDAKYRRVAEQAFNYERRWFNADVGNWPDFREEPRQGKQSKRPPSFATSWCHGAPGIALSRLRAYEVLKDETYEAEAMTALQTTRQIIKTWLHSGTGSFSLCNGVAGNTEVLLYGHQVLGWKLAEESKLAFNVANAGIKMHAIHGLPWSSETSDGETPSLMLGLAGIGYFYLRLYDPAIPSILILQRESLSNRSR